MLRADHAAGVVLRLLPSCMALAPAISAQETPSVSIPFTIVAGRPHVNVTLNGHAPLPYMIDMGASGDGRIDRSLLNPTGAVIVDSTQNGDGVTQRWVPVARIDRLAFGGVERREVRFLVGDYRRTTADTVSRWGILGANLFAEQTVTFDYPNRRMVLSSVPLVRGAPGVIAAGDGDNFEAPLSFGSDTLPAHLDTGSSLTLHLPIGIAQRLGVDSLTPAGTGRRQYSTFPIFRGRANVPIRLGDIVLPSDLDLYFSAVMTDRANVGGGVLGLLEVSYDQRNGLMRLVAP